MLLPGVIHGSIDAPETGSEVGRTIVVEGWAFGVSSPVSFVDVWLGGCRLGRAGLGRARPDVALAFPHVDAGLSGFALHRDITALPLSMGRGRLEAAVTLLDGTRARLPPVEIEIHGSDPLSAAPSRRLEVARPLRASRARRRILSFERALGRGGSQLRLLELIEELTRCGEAECTVLAHADGLLRTRLERSGATVRVEEPVPLRDAAAYERRMQDLAAWSADRFDLVVAHTLTSFPGIDLALRLGLPSIWRVGEAEPLTTVAGWIDGALHPCLEARARDAFGAASWVVFNSEAALHAQQASGAEGRFTVIKTGVDVAAATAYRAGNGREAMRSTLGIPDAQRLLLCLGALWPLKGQALLIQAVRHLRAQGAVLGCVLAGEPSDAYAAELERLAAQPELAGAVRILPFLDDVRPWLLAADALVCPSESESMPSSVLEAMAFGLPVLASSAGGLPELVEPGRTGWLFEPSHLGSLCSVLEQVAATPTETLRELGAAGARRVYEAHDRGAALRRMVELIREATA